MSASERSLREWLQTLAVTLSLAGTLWGCAWWVATAAADDVVQSHVSDGEHAEDKAAADKLREQLAQVQVTVEQVRVEQAEQRADVRNVLEAVRELRADMRRRQTE